jgi:DNA invertase Pin-like site-specific DNA recombinase
MKRMTRAALYARVSSDAQQKEGTIESQVAELKRQIAAAGHELVNEYIDDGVTGTVLDRPALEQLRQDTKTDLFDRIYFQAADRIARQPAHQTIIIDELLKRGKQITIGGKDYEENPENKMTLNMLGVFAEYERAKITERMTRGRLHRLRKGELSSNGHRIYGYHYVKKTPTAPASLSINEKQAAVVRAVFEMFASGQYGLVTICRHLEQQRILTRTGKSLWDNDRVKEMLKNETYAGTRYFNRITAATETNRKGKEVIRGKWVYRDRAEWIAVTVPAIVSRELFDKVQERLAQHDKRYCRPATHYLLSGLVQCGCCGSRGSSSRRWLRVPRPSGKVSVYHQAHYRCIRCAEQHQHYRERVEDRCQNSMIATHILEGQVFQMIQEVMLDPATLRGCIKSGAGLEDRSIARELSRVAAHIKGLDDERRRLIGLYAAEQMAGEEYIAAIERLAGKGGDPVIGLQTSFGGGKTHTMLALYHLASAKNPETLAGLAEILKDAGVATLPMRSRPVAFVGTAAGANQPFPVNGARTVRSLWGLIAVKLGGWKAYETIKSSDEARTNPGSEAMIAILKQAAPCLILLDEVVAYARNLEGIPYDGFVSFLQSLTEAANAVPGVLVVGSLPESGAEVGNQRGREALLALEKVFGRVQSAWAPAQGTETFEIIRRRLFQELDPEGEKAREQAVKSFTSYYKNNAGEFPSGVRDRAYEAQLIAAYPVHPELFLMLQADWGGLEKFQKTRGVLKMMAQIVYRLWRDGHGAPMILPGDVPLTDDKVRTNALVPLPTGYDAVITKEVAGDLSKPAQIEARSPSIGKNKAVTRAATALFMGTAPHGSTNKGMEVARSAAGVRCPRRAALPVLRGPEAAWRECGLSLQRG